MAEKAPPSFVYEPYSDGPNGLRAREWRWKQAAQAEAGSRWNKFYNSHGDKFFKDRHYLQDEFPELLAVKQCQLAELGCGAGNTIFPLLEVIPDIFVHACDFAASAIDVVKSNPTYSEARINAFVCDISTTDPVPMIPPQSCDFCSLIFVLSAMVPAQLPPVLSRIKMILKPGGCVLFRDYATQDMAQLRFEDRRRISENLYIRGDGTLAYYFTAELVEKLFREAGFTKVRLTYEHRKIVNVKEDKHMDRIWLQGVFRMPL